MSNPSPHEIIAAFDEVLDFVYGRRYGRDYPSKDDEKYAQAWIDDGLTVPIASAVFFLQMSLMHERWLRQKDPNDRTNIPRNVGVFDSNIRSATARVKAGGEPIDMADRRDSEWRARIKGWIKSPKVWRDMMFHHWGMPPDDRECRAPIDLLLELVPQHWKKTAGNEIVFIKNNLQPAVLTGRGGANGTARR